MKIANRGCKVFTTLFALLLFVCAAGLAPVAFAQKQSSGGVRAADGQSLRITVLLNGKPWAKASVVIKNADGSTAVSGWTGADGTYTTNSLGAGEFTVTSSTVHYTATSNVTLTKSTETAFVKHTLAKKTLASPEPEKTTAPITPPPHPPAK